MDHPSTVRLLTAASRSGMGPRRPTSLSIQLAGGRLSVQGGLTMAAAAVPCQVRSAARRRPTLTGTLPVTETGVELMPYNWLMGAFSR